MKRSVFVQLLALALALCLLAGCGAAPEAQSTPEAPAEYRALWLSYLEYGTMDFSSEAAFRAQAAQVMENSLALGLNTVIAQVRPYGDALYESALFPWSHLCTGTQGQAPGYDPLTILLEEAHSRGLRLEAWVNPYRIQLDASTPVPAEALADTSPAVQHPDWVKAAAGGLYLDPASPEVRQYIIDGVVEIVERYPVDGIHFDDYFYPTTDPAFDEAEYAASGTPLSLEDWRRENVNALVQGVYDAIKARAPGVPFGISPQGNRDNNYSGQYSDVDLWMSQGGYVDYVMPQIYWGYGYQLQSGSDRFAFENITAEWMALPRAPSVALYFGLGAYRIGDGDGGSNDTSLTQWQTGHNLADMVTDLRARGGAGYALFRYDHLFRTGYAQLAAQECANLAAANAPAEAGGTL